MSKSVQVELLLLLACGLAAAAEPRPGRIEFSDGKLLGGKISLTPGSALQLHVGTQLRTLSLDRVQEIRLSPEKESLEQHYRFPEAGKAIKETSGQPYPVRLLKTTLVLADGETLTGHLYTTVLYVENDDATQKVILLAKQSGREGQALEDLVYPARVVFADSAVATEATSRLKLPASLASPGAEVVALTRGALVRLAATSAGPPGEFQMPSSLGAQFFLAVHLGAKLSVGWPTQPDPQLIARVRAALPNSSDFFDDRKLLGAFRDARSGEIYSLLLASRQAATTLDQDRSQPWRLELCRWKQDTVSPRLLLAGQGYFFRGLGAKNESVPAVELSAMLWQVRKQGDTWTVGNNGTGD